MQFSLANSTTNYFLESNAWPPEINFRKKYGKTETIFECLTFWKFFARWSGFDEHLMQIFAVVESTEGNKLVIKWIHSLNFTQFYSQIRSILIGCKIWSSMIKSASHYYSFLLLLFMLKDFTFLKTVFFLDRVRSLFLVWNSHWPCVFDFCCCCSKLVWNINIIINIMKIHTNKCSKDYE